MAAENAAAGEAAPKKRILVVSQHFWPENFRISDIVAGLVAGGVEVDVLCGLPNYPDGEWFAGYSYAGPRREQYEGAEIFRSGEVRRKGNTSLRILLNYVSFPALALLRLPRLKKRRYDAVFCYETSPVLMIYPAIAAAKRHKAPLTAYVLDLWPDNLYSVLPVKNRFLRWVAQSVSDWHYKRCTRLIAMSDQLAQRLAEVTKDAKAPPEITVIPQYCEDFYAAQLHDDALAKRFAGRFNLLFAGNLSPAQDLENLIEAVKRVHAAGHTALRVLVVGDGMSRAALEALVVREGLEKDVLFCGRQRPEDIPRWTGMADALFAGLSKSENLGLTVPGKIPSYFAAGRPMLVAADGEAARVAEESGAALVSPAGDAEALAENMIALLLMDDAERRRLAENGRACYEAEYRRGPLLEKLQSFILYGKT